MNEAELDVGQSPSHVGRLSQAAAPIRSGGMAGWQICPANFGITLEPDAHLSTNCMVCGIVWIATVQ